MNYTKGDNKDHYGHRGQGRGRGRGYGRDRDCDRGRGRGRGRGKSGFQSPHYKKDGPPENKRPKNKVGQDGKPFLCHSCGSPEHFANKCTSPDWLKKQYKVYGKYLDKKEPESHHTEVKVQAIHAESPIPEVDWDDEDFMEVDVPSVLNYNVTAGEDLNENTRPDGIFSVDILPDSGTTHCIFNERSFFVKLNTHTNKFKIGTISGNCYGEGRGRAEIQLMSGTVLVIKDAIYAPTSCRNLLSYDAIRSNGLHITTAVNEYGYECLQIYDEKSLEIEEEFLRLPNNLYSGSIKPSHIEANQAEASIENDAEIWHQRLGHPGSSVMKGLADSLHGLKIDKRHVDICKSINCTACMQGTLKSKQAPAIFDIKKKNPFAYLYYDTAGPIRPLSGSHRYYLAGRDHSGVFITAHLLQSRNQTFVKILTDLIRIRSQYPEYPVSTIIVDGAREFNSNVFMDYCTSLGIELLVSLPYEHNMLGENIVKRLQHVARPLLLQSNLPPECWGLAILHAKDLLQLRPIPSQGISPLQILTGVPPSVKHIRVFGCAVHVPIPAVDWIKIGPRRQLGIYVGFYSQSIIRYIDPTSGEQHKAPFRNCVFDERRFPSLGGGIKDREQTAIQWDWKPEDHQFSDFNTGEGDREVTRLLKLKFIADHTPDAFVESHELLSKDRIGTAGERPKAISSQLPPTHKIISKTQIPLPPKQPNKRLKPDDEAYIPTSNITPIETTLRRSRRIAAKAMMTPETNLLYLLVSGEQQFTDSPPGVSTYHSFEKPIATYSSTPLHRNIIFYDDMTCYHIAVALAEDDEPDPSSVSEALSQKSSEKWKEAMKAEMKSLMNREVFGPIQECPVGVTPIGGRWVFVKKRNAQGEVARYKARFVAQGFTQRYGTDYTFTYSPVIDITTLRWLVCLAVTNNLRMVTNDVVTAYLYGKMDTEIFMNVPPGFPGASKSSTTFKRACVKVLRALYGLKQSGRMWYQCLADYLKKQGFISSDICPCVYIKRVGQEFVIIAIYVDDLNIIGTDVAVSSAIESITKKFEVRDLGDTKFLLGLQLEYVQGGIIVHQSTYTKKILKKFNMHDVKNITSIPLPCKSSKTPDNDVTSPLQEGEEVLGEEVPYAAAIGGLMYLANCTRPDISFAVNLLSRHNRAPTKRHWKGVLHIFRYLKGTEDYGLFYRKDFVDGDSIVGYADAGYQSDPYSGKSQTGYVFLSGGAAISWRSQKQTIVTTSSNHSELIALYEASRENFWLRSVTNFIRTSIGRPELKKPTIIYEDNEGVILQLKDGYIKGDRVKHIDPKYFYTREQLTSDLDIQSIGTNDNTADIFTKSLGRILHQKHCDGLGLRRVSDLVASARRR